MKESSMRRLQRAWAVMHYRAVQELKKKAEFERSMGFEMTANHHIMDAKIQMAWFEFATIGRPKMREEIIREYKK